MTMRDPHVTALHYVIIHNPTVDYSKAKPKDFETERCKVHVQGKHVTFTFKEQDHFATDKEAQDALKPFINAWEVFVGLDRGPGQWELQYEGVDIIDRDPDPQTMLLGAARMEIRTGGILTGPNEYPPPPSVEFSVSGDVLAAYDRYKRYSEDRELLASMAYFVLTVIEAPKRQERRQTGRRRQEAADRYFVDPDVLNKLGELSSEAGGQYEARKHHGEARSYTDEEKRWIKEAVVVLIRRTGERDARPTDTLPLITMNDLPPLP